MTLANNLQIKGLVYDMSEDDNGDIVNQRNMNDDRDKENPTHKFLESTIDKSTKLNAITKQVKVSIIDDNQSDEDDNDDSAILDPFFTKYFVLAITF